MQYKNQTVLTGIKPTGTPHLGNLIGAVMPVIELAKKSTSSFVFIADIHALNSVFNPKELNRNTYEIAATFIALGLDTEKTNLFRQSDVPEIYQLATLLNNVTPKGLMNRSHAYKAAVEANISQGYDPDANINLGLYHYPVLMAADILLYQTNLVPVGKDQQQHIEIARDIAGSFNAACGGNVFTIPEAVIQKDTQSIPGLDGRKMSKSYKNYIPIFESSENLKKLIMRIVTDSKKPDDPKNPEGTTIFQLYKLAATPDQVEFMRRSFLQGEMGYGEAKQMLFEVLDLYLAEPRKRYNDLIANTDFLDWHLKMGADRAREIAAQTMVQVSEKMFGRNISQQSFHMNK